MVKFFSSEMLEAVQDLPGPLQPFGLLGVSEEGSLNPAD